MAITEQQRFEMHLGLRETLGDDVANSLMEHLPPSGWSDVVRLSDLRSLEQRIDHHIDSVVTRIDRLENRMDHLENRMDHLENQMDHLENRMDRMNGSFRVLTASMITVSVAILVMFIQLNMTIARL